MGANHADFQGANSPITPAICKHCGKEISTDQIARIGLDNGATYLFPPKAPSFRRDENFKGYSEHDWGHKGLSDIVLNGEGTLGQLANDPEWNHKAEPLDGRSHDEDYHYHAFKTRMGNIAKGADPTESMELAMKPYSHTARSIARDGFGVV
jgi:hypothetical protein